MPPTTPVAPASVPSLGRSTAAGRYRAAFIGVLALILIVTSVQYIQKVSKPGDSGRMTRSAFLRWREMINEVFAGSNVYTGLNEYPNPPVMAIILRPFAELPPITGALGWFYAKVIMAIVAAVWVFRLVSPPLPPGPPIVRTGVVPDGVKAVAILMTLPPILGDLTHNNVNIFILFLIAGCLELYRRNRDFTAGAVLGLAIACKVTPLLFLAYFGWKRSWRVVVGCALGLAFWLWILPGAVFGWDRNAHLLTDWYRLMVERPVLKGEVTTEHPNQAIPGVVYRLFTHSPSYIDYLDPGTDKCVPIPGAYHNLVDIGRPAAWCLTKALGGLFVLALVWLCRTPRSFRQGARFAAECGLIVLGMLLFSERTWKHHAVTLLLPAAVLAFAAVRIPAKRRRITALLIAVGAIAALPGLLGGKTGDLAMVYGVHTLGFLLLALGLGIILRSRDDLYGLSGPNGRIVGWRELIENERSEQLRALGILCYQGESTSHP